MKRYVMVVVGFVFSLARCGGSRAPVEEPSQGAEADNRPADEAETAQSRPAQSQADQNDPEATEAESDETEPEAPDTKPPTEREEEVKEASQARITDKNIVISGKVLFETGKAKLKKVSYEVLDEVVFAMQKHPEIVKLQVVGHTDSDGDAKANKRLSKKRATAVMNYFIRSGIERDRLSSLGEGEDVPIASNDTEEGKDKNRRVEFVIIERVPIRAVTHTTSTANEGRVDSREATQDETEALIKREGIDKKLP